jgi:hypothetical protein
MKRATYRAFVAERPWLTYLFSRFYFEGKRPGQQDCGWKRKAEMWTTENVQHLAERPLVDLDLQATDWATNLIPIGRISIKPGQRRTISANMSERYYFVGDKDPAGLSRPEQFRPNYGTLGNDMTVKKYLDEVSKHAFVRVHAVVKRIDAGMAPLCKSISIHVYRLPEVELPPPRHAHW